MIGKVLGNRYEIVEKIGVGGMAVVYKAMDKLLNRYVAVKLLRSEFEGNEEFIRRFNIESQAAASLSHPNIVPIYDVGQSGTLQYIIMEYIDGITLKQYISEKKGAIYWKEATDISMQICSALEHAHSKHIIHRDIKPQNIMINKDGVIKVTDFGIARAANNVTTTMEAVGSAHYLSPEQARGGYTDQRSDIYSLGVVMYELFTGRLPFDGETPISVAMQHMQADPIKPRAINPDIPQAIEDIILKAMSKEQRLRYESAAEMLADLKKAYTDPDAEIKKAADEETDKFGTKIMPPIVNITMTDDGGNSQPSAEKPLVRRTREQEEEKIRKTVPKTKQKKKGDTLAVVLAVITCLAVAGVLGFIVSNIVLGNRQVEGEYRVPNLINLSLEEAQNAIKDTEFTIAIESRENSSTVPEDAIISQDPEARTVLDEPCEIRLVVSLGVATFRLDDYTGQDYAKVRDLLSGSDYGLKVTINMENSDTVPGGIIIRQLPSQGAEMKTGDSITLYVSEGAEEDLVKVPNLMGLDESAAKMAIVRNGLKLGNVIPYESDSEEGLVVNQSLVVDTMVERDTEIDIFVSTGKAEVQENNQNSDNQSGGQSNADNDFFGNQSGGNSAQDNGNSSPQTSDSGL